MVRFVNRYIRRRTGVDCWSQDFEGRPNFLDLGSGAGRHLAFLWENGFFPVGIELSEKACDQAMDLMMSKGAEASEFVIHAISSTELSLEDSSISYGIGIGQHDHTRRSEIYC